MSETCINRQVGIPIAPMSVQLHRKRLAGKVTEFNLRSLSVHQEGGLFWLQCRRECLPKFDNEFQGTALGVGRRPASESSDSGESHRKFACSDVLCPSEQLHDLKWAVLAAWLVKGAIFAATDF